MKIIWKIVEMVWTFFQRTAAKTYLVRQNFCWLNVFQRFHRLIRQQFLTPEFTGGQFYKFLLFQRKENWSLKILIRDRCIDRKSHAHWKSSVFIFHQYLLYNNSPLFGDLQLKIKYSSGRLKTPSPFLFWHERKSSRQFVNAI